MGLILSEERAWMKALYGACSYVLFLTLMLTKSRGALLLFPVAVIIFMVSSPKKTRVKLFSMILLLASPAIVISLYISPYLSAEETNRNALAFLAAGMLITVLFATIGEYLGNLLQKIHKHVYIGLIITLLIILPLASIHVINASVPIELMHDNDEENSFKSIYRHISLPPGEYALKFELDAKSEKEQPYICHGRIFSQTREDVIFERSTLLIAKNFMETSGLMTETIEFTVPENSVLLMVEFINYYSGTSATLNNAEIIDISGKTVKKIVLKNKYNLETLITRFQNITQDRSGMVRFIYYNDGIKIFKDHWFLGGGGGAWEYLYRQYQSYKYSSSQAHNYPLQLGIETGIIGLIILLSLVIIFIWGYLKYVKKTQDRISSDLFINAAVMTAIASLLMHAVIDFDFSESAMLLLFWELIALFNREMINSQVFKKKTIIKAKKSYHKNTIVGIVCVNVVCVIALGVSVCFYSASLNAKKAFRYIQQSKFEEAINCIDLAIRLDKFNEKYVIGYNPISSRSDIKAGLADILFAKADLLQQKLNDENGAYETERLKLQQQFSEMYELVLKVEKGAKNNLTLSANLASFYFKMGDIEKGIEYLNHAIQLFPFDPSLWYSKTNIYFELTKSYYNNADDENAKKYLEQGLNIIKEAMEVNKMNMDPFMFDGKTVEILQIMKYIYDNYNKPQMVQVNGLKHYTIPNLDINLDKIPDQWQSGDYGLINVTASDHGINVSVKDSGYIYALSPIKLEKGKVYEVEVLLDKPDINLSFQLAGLTSNINLLHNKNNLYSNEFLVENVPNGNGDQFRIFLDKDCIIKMIKVTEKVE
ncbi:MAG: O-antigen ligase family protein, partial [Candidatus Methanofastidiosa archaeon]|nr:O-antigen ligase family protein [Candidatus Methanofastidiosa archaeon]